MFAVTLEGGLLFAEPDVCQTPTPASPVPPRIPILPHLSSVRRRLEAS
jgi:hypothetical protein